MNELKCKAIDVTLLSDEVYRIRIAPKQGDIFEYEGGQYLYLLMPDGKRIPLSIASAPQESNFLELHIRLIEGHELAEEMINLFKTASTICVEGPYGHCTLRRATRPIVIIAGGTGFSPMKSLIESAFEDHKDINISLYLGAQNPQDFYQNQIIDSWPSNKNFKFVPVLGNEVDEWKGAVGYPHEIALKDIDGDVMSCDFYISGSEPMVMNVYQTLCSKGVEKDHIYSDILDIKREMGQLD